ncbi:MAG: response regulator [Proteobacteria bacterium]|nr:response regulator [Pseudomonadota bacterium]
MNGVDKSPDGRELDLAIRVQDSGIGIPEDQVDLIFESFRQREGQSNRKFGGTGLGLTITKRLIQMMGGEISVESAVGKGTTLHILLRDVAISKTKPRETTPDRSLPFRDIRFEKALVLVVDDIAANREVVSELLDRAGLEVIEAEEGERALIFAQERLPDLIFMDIRMPVMDGYQATKRMKSEPKTRHIPVVALTASAQTEDEAKIMSSGFDGFLFKPIEMEPLFRHLSKYLTVQTKDAESDAVPASPPQPPPISTLSEVKDINLLLETLKNTMLQEWENLKGAMDMEAIRTFTERVLRLSEEHRADDLESYSRNMLDDIEHLDLEGIEHKLAAFPTEIERLEAC